MKHTIPPKLPTLLGYSRSDQLKAESARLVDVADRLKSVVASVDVAGLDSLIAALSPPDHDVFKQYFSASPYKKDEFLVRAYALGGVLSEQSEKLTTSAKNAGGLE